LVILVVFALFDFFLFCPSVFPFFCQLLFVKTLEVKDISKLIKEEIAGLIKSEVKFEMSHVPEFPNMAKTHSEANLYMKSYMHNTTFASGAEILVHATSQI
jgi:hypothetical protein